MIHLLSKIATFTPPTLAQVDPTLAEPRELGGTFWLPPDPACEGRSLMHADAELKGHQERFVFRVSAAYASTSTHGL